MVSVLNFIDLISKINGKFIDKQNQNFDPNFEKNYYNNISFSKIILTNLLKWTKVNILRIKAPKIIKIL